MSEDKPLRPRLGRIGDTGNRSGRRTARNLQSARRVRPSNLAFTGVRIWAGQASVTRSRQSARLSARHVRRVIVKVHIAKAGRGGAGLYRAHLGYLQRDGVDQEGRGGVLYDREHDRADGRAFLGRSEHDPHQFRIIVSPEDGARLRELRTHTRNLMTQMERDLGRRLDWVATDHYNTGHPHTHIVIRGRDARQRDVVIARNYLTHGLRQTAEDLMTQRLGPRRAMDIIRAQQAELHQDRWTGCDRQIETAVTNGHITLSKVTTGRARFDQSLTIRRLQHLETLNLAREVKPRVWEMKTGWQDRLKEAGRRGDIIRSLPAAARMRESGLSFVDDLPPDTGPRLGLVKSSGPEDELRDTRYLLVEEFEGRTVYVPATAIDGVTPPPQNAIVELSRAAATPRASDRAIANLAGASGGVWSEALHARFDPGATPAYRLSLKRRLEALRRAGIGDRFATGEWRIDHDFLAKAGNYELTRSGGVKLVIQSWIPVNEQIEMMAETWLDRADPKDLSDAPQLRALYKERQRFLRQMGRLGAGEDRLSPAQRAELRTLEIRQAEQTIETNSMRTALALGTGDRFTGRLETLIDLGQGRFAVVGSKTQFALLPWRATLDRQVGREIRIERAVRGVSWSFAQTPKRGVSR